jgi:hypothetical protein
VAAFGEKLFPPRREKQAPPDPVKQLETQVLFETSDLSRQHRLRDAQYACRLQDSAMPGNCGERAEALEIHRRSLCANGIKI